MLVVDVIGHSMWLLCKDEQFPVVLILCSSCLSFPIVQKCNAGTHIFGHFQVCVLLDITNEMLQDSFTDDPLPDMTLYLI